jgi:hypothetical protein
VRESLGWLKLPSYTKPKGVMKVKALLAETQGRCSRAVLKLTSGRTPEAFREILAIEDYQNALRAYTLGPERW